MRERVLKKVSNNHKVAAIAFFISFILFSLWYSGNATGFCYKEFRYLSDEEFIDKYLSQINAKKVSSEEVDDYLKQTEREGFVVEYPECCIVQGISKENSPLFGWDVINLSINYPDRYAKPNDQEPFYYSIIAIDACGKIRDSLGGMPISKEQYDIYLKSNSRRMNK